MANWLFKPFERISGEVALTLGLVGIVLTALVARLGGLQTDGVLDLHFAEDMPLWKLLVQGLLNWLVLAGMLLVTGRWLSSSRFRVIDLLGTQAAARWPMLLAGGYLAIPAIGNRISQLSARMMEQMPAEPGQVTADLAHLLEAMWLTLLSLPILLSLAWMVWLMYHGYARVCRISGMRAVFSFIGVLIAAEIITSGLAILI